MNKDVVGIAGCGTMGLPMAQRLAAAGYEVWGHDVRPTAEFGEFSSRMVANSDEFSRRCNIVISVVRDAAQTHALLFGDSQGIKTVTDLRYSGHQFHTVTALCSAIA